jgi:hypothetical protein
MERYEILKELVMEAIESQSPIDLNLICSRSLSPTEGLTLATEAVSQGILSENKEKQGIWNVAPGLNEAELTAALARLCWKQGWNTQGVQYGWKAFGLLKKDPAAIDKTIALCEEIFEVSGIVGGALDSDYPGARLPGSYRGG